MAIGDQNTPISNGNPGRVPFFKKGADTSFDINLTEQELASPLISRGQLTNSGYQEGARPGAPQLTTPQILENAQVAGDRRPRNADGSLKPAGLTVGSGDLTGRQKVPTFDEARAQTQLHGLSAQEKASISTAVTARFAPQFRRLELMQTGRQRRFDARMAQQSGGTFGASQGEEGGIRELEQIRFDQTQELEGLKNAAIQAQTRAARATSRKEQLDEMGLANDLIDRVTKGNQQLFQNNLAMDKFKLDAVTSLEDGQEFSYTDSRTGKAVTMVGESSEAIKPFFTGSNFTTMMTSMDEGQTAQVRDSNTGEVHTIRGLKASKPNTKIIEKLDDNGDLSIITYDLDEKKVVSVSVEKGVGKTKTKAARTSINLPTLNRKPILDSKGKQVGFQIFDPKRGKTENVDFNDAPLKFPLGGKVVTFSSGNTKDSDEDPNSNSKLAT